MPTENELKFVINPECEDKIKKLASKTQHILQGYLATSKGMVVRIRQEISNKSVCTMTFKRKVKKRNYTDGKTKSRVIEIEKNISSRDFLDLWPVALNKLEKIRYDIKRKSHLWEVDFFLDHDHEIYFAQAEVELAEDLEAPDSIPKFISNNLLYAVPADDDRFGSKRLADIKYAKALLKHLTIIKS